MKFSKVTLIFVAVTCLGFTLSPVSLQTNKNQPFDSTKLPLDCFQLSAEAEKETFRLGEPVRINVKFTNVTDHLCKLILSGVYDYKITVKDESGAIRPKTEYLEKLLKFGPSSYRGIGVDPGESYVDIFTMNSLYDMTTPGSYSITFKRIIYLEPSFKKKVELTSTVKVKIIGAN